jgi:hypothetical protein
MQGRKLLMKKIPKKNREFLWQVIHGEAVLLNPNDGKYFGLNHVGCSFWEKVDGNRSIDAIVNLLLDEYDISREILETDIKALIDSLEANRILTFE